MVIDTSAIIAILRLEPEAQRFIESIASAPVRLMAAVGVLEASLVLAGPQGGRDA